MKLCVEPESSKATRRHPLMVTGKHMALAVRIPVMA